jgi:predicted nucleotidyltransferase
VDDRPWATASPVLLPAGGDRRGLLPACPTRVVRRIAALDTGIREERVDADIGTDVDRERLAAVCRRYGIATLLVFGSAARGTSTTSSDLDLLYELTPGAQLGWQIDDLADELSEIFGRTVDLVSRRSASDAGLERPR